MSNIITKRFTGICPKTNDDKSIPIDYLKSNNNLYIKGRFECNNRFCTDENCPIYENAPKTL